VKIAPKKWPKRAKKYFLTMRTASEGEFRLSPKYTDFHRKYQSAKKQKFQFFIVGNGEDRFGKEKITLK
jgi:hypothetical protein